MSTLAFLLTQTVNALSQAALLFFLGVGLTLIFGIMRIVNFAHGALYMLGAYFGVFLLGLTKNFWLSLVVAPLMVFVLGLAIERVLVRPLYGRSIDDPLLLTFGLSLVVVEAVRIVWGKIGLTIDPPRALSGALDLGFMTFPLYRFFVIAVTMLVLVGLWLFLERTNVGLIIRAGSRDPLMVRALGLDLGRVWLLVFGIGAGLAGLAGVVGGTALSISPGEDTRYLLASLVVVIVGGMGSVVGASIGALLIGLAEQFGLAYAPTYSVVFTFVIMVVALAFRPRGLMGRGA